MALVVALRPLLVEELGGVPRVRIGTNGEKVPLFEADCRPEDQREAVLSNMAPLISVVDD